MVNLFNHMDNFIFVISKNRKVKFANKAALNKIKINLKDLVDTPVKDCLYSNGKSIDNLIDSLVKGEEINFDFYLEINNKKYELNGDLLQSNFYGEKSYFIIARDVCEKYYKREDLEILLDNINMGCFIKSKKGEYLYTNKRKCDFHNKKKEDIIGSKSCDLFDEEEVEYIEKIENEVIKRNEPFSEENRFKVNGQKRWYEITLDSILNEDGSFKYMIGSSRNIEIRKHLDKTLDYITLKFREINEFLNEEDILYQRNIMNLLNYISEKIMINFQADGVGIVFYKEKEKDFSALIGKGISLGESSFNIVEKKQIFKESFSRYNEEREPEGIKYVDEIDNKIIVEKLKAKNIYKIGVYNICAGGKLLGHIIINFIRDTKSMEYGYDYIKTICSHLAVTISNINQSIKIKKELNEYKERKEYLQKCIDISVDIVGKIDKYGKIIYVNEDRLQSILGWNAKEFEEIKEIKEIKNKYKNMDKNDLAIHQESQITCKNGKYKWLEWNIKQYKDEESLFFTAKDITAKKHYEKQQQLLEEAVELEGLKNKFFNNLSHEFRTPINIILGTVQLIEQCRNKDNYNLENLDYHIDIIKRNSYRLLRLVQNLLDLSQIESQYYNTSFGNYNIIEIVEDITMSVATYLKNKNINLIFDTNCEEQVICCDPEKIERIVLNLLSNAIKYNRDNNDIEVYIEVSEASVKIYVKDHGIGIEKTELENIFDEFKKVDDGLTRSCEGSGIGLSIVNEFARIHKGRVNVFSKLGEGTTFEVILPNQINDSRESVMIKDDRLGQNKVERCNIEFSDIYN
ncbi:MAG: ATP-binding protein [Intestinibacter bartlettii]|uniref:sensor histidine kinase n=1 Tax=Intestinibacter bartlettii TaxID=261299 RepID=UPI0026F322A6|nr:PAS domain-containing sensor histidine kinase [Intestinibacter bartlettii]MDO5011626.1 ATP-binding protein [Intestinibacter bartlettii]